MSIQSIFYIILGIYLIIFCILQLYIAYRIRTIKLQAASAQPATEQMEMGRKNTFRYSIFHITFQSFLIIFALYDTFTRILPWYLGVLFIAICLIWMRKPVRWARDSYPISPGFSIILPLQPKTTETITPEFILDLLSQESVIQAIKNDLSKTHQLGCKETWCLALLTPDRDIYDLLIFQESYQKRLSRMKDYNFVLNLDNQVAVKRAAVVHSKPYFNVLWNRVQVYHGTTERLIRQYPGWMYSLSPMSPGKKFIDIRDIEISPHSASLYNRSPVFTKFLQEDGFPIRDQYIDGDPLTTERGGTIIIDKGKLKIIYPEYFVQTRLIDDTGKLIYLGLDELFSHRSSFQGVSIAPSTSKNLYKCVKNNEFVPVVRYRSFPYISDFMLPILDTPISDSGWADLFISPSGKGKLFIAKEKTQEEWFEMMTRLKALFFEELAKKGCHLLDFAKDPAQLNIYFSKKQSILEDFFIIRDWSLP